MRSPAGRWLAPCAMAGWHERSPEHLPAPQGSRNALLRRLPDEKNAASRPPRVGPALPGDAVRGLPPVSGGREAARGGRPVRGVPRRARGRLPEGGPMIATVPLVLLFVLLLVLNDRATARAARI